MEAQKDKLRRYIDHTKEIRALSSPQVRDVSDPDGYRACLMENFIHIGNLYRDNKEILGGFLLPFIRGEGGSDAKSREAMQVFSAEFIDAYQLTNIDAPLVYYQALRLLEEADASGEDEAIIRALDSMVTASYLMLCMTARLIPVDMICLKYQREGLKAGERLLAYLEPSKFTSLSQEMKQLVVINARYIRVVMEIDGVQQSPEELEQILQRMREALALAEDPFYRDQLPDYNWDLHRFRVYEYICSLPDSANEKGFTQEQLAFIHDCTRKMWALYQKPESPCRAWHLAKNITLYVMRDAYLDREIDKESYKRQLEELILRDFRDDPADDVPMVMLQVPLEYLLLLNKAPLTGAEEEKLREQYKRLIRYLHQTPKRDMLTFLLGVLSLILRHFIELPEGGDFENMGMGLLAAVHPITFVHTLSVAQLSRVLTHHLLKENPALFVGIPGIETAEEAWARREEIEDYAYHAALCHDFGKLMIAETIMTYGRDLLEDEIEFIHAHPAIGAWLLARYPSTEAYADVARGHHKWYNDQGGYPEDFRLSESPWRTVIALVSCADCLDAATDSIGRSYKKGKTLDQVLAEIRQQSGSRYAPWLPALLEKEEVRAEIETILEAGREENYRRAYHILGEQ